MTRKLKKKLKRIIISSSLFVIIKALDFILSINNGDLGLSGIIKGKLYFLLPFILYMSIYLYIGYNIIIKCFINICHGRVFDENFLMTFATFGAIGLGIYNAVLGKPVHGFDEACAVFIFYSLGEWFENFAIGKSRKSICSLMEIRPDFAVIFNEKDNSRQKISPENVKIGDIIVVESGEKIPVDGVVVNGESQLDTKSLTGESIPIKVGVGASVLSGSINISNTLFIKVQKEYRNSTVSKILELTLKSSEKKSKAESFITKFSGVYTPVVVVSAIVLGVLPPLFFGNFETWIYRALEFLVISCPCALIISVPLTFMSGISNASKKGILIKGSEYLEKLSKLKAIVFDKTGTITKGSFEILDVYPKENRREILRLSSIAEQNSSHPIAKSIVSEYDGDIEKGFTTQNILGKGIIASKGKTTIACGNNKLMEYLGINYTPSDRQESVVYVAKNNVFLGYILVGDKIKEQAKDVIGELNFDRIKTVMLTGDTNCASINVAKEVGFKEFKAQLLPQDKVYYIEKIMQETDGFVGFVGDGVNDAPSLMRADIGISMGGVGADASIEASDIVLMKDDLKDIPKILKIAKHTMNIAYQNIFFAISVKALILILSALGFANMWLAVFGDVGVSIIAILNAMRVSKVKQVNK